MHCRLCLIPLNPSAVSPSAKLVAHLSRRYPAEEHHAYHLEHRLFSDTSSQLPGSDVKLRSFTHVLTLSHNPQSTFVCTTKAGNPADTSLITIPVTSTDAFTTLIVSKFQPLWYLRQAVVVENGISVSVRDDEWKVCIGDVKIAPKSPGAGTLRGLIIELCHTVDEPEGSTSQDTAEEDQAMFQDVLDELFKGTGESFNDAKIIITRTSNRVGATDEVGTKSTPDWDLAKLYMNVLRGQGPR